MTSSHVVMLIGGAIRVDVDMTSTVFEESGKMIRAVVGLVLPLDH